MRTELPAARFRDKLQALLERSGLPERVVTAPESPRPHRSCRVPCTIWLLAAPSSALLSPFLLTSGWLRRGAGWADE